MYAIVSYFLLIDCVAFRDMIPKKCEKDIPNIKLNVFCWSDYIISSSNKHSTVLLYPSQNGWPKRCTIYRRLNSRATCFRCLIYLDDTMVVWYVILPLCPIPDDWANLTVCLFACWVIHGWQNTFTLLMHPVALLLVFMRFCF